MVNLKKIERMKNKSDFAHKRLGLRDIKNVNCRFIIPSTITESNIQLLLVPFISYNLSYPMKSTRFAFLNHPEHNGFSFQLVGRNAKVPMRFQSTINLNSKEALKQWAHKKEVMLRKEFQKAYNTVYNDLDGDPKVLWYNIIKNIQIPIDILEHISEHFTHQIVIFTERAELDKSGQIPISLIELPNSITSPTLVKASPLYS